MLQRNCFALDKVFHVIKDCQLVGFVVLSEVDGAGNL